MKEVGEKPTTKQITILYDGECPVCSTYTSYVALKELGTELVLQNARDKTELVFEANRRGLVLDQGMIVIVGDNWYHGAQAMHVLAAISAKNTVFGKINYFIFRSRILAHVLYPVLKLGWSTLLLIMQKKKMGY